MNRSEQLSAGYKETTVLSKELRGLRCFKDPSAPDKTVANPNETYRVRVPPLNPDECIIPDTFALSFNFENSNTKSWFLNNLGRLLIAELEVRVQGKAVYKNSGESVIEVYKDLWRSNADRENRQEYGIANENVRKLISKDDSADKAAKTDDVLDVTIANVCDRMKIPLGKVLCDNGPFAPYGMCEFVYNITLPPPGKIMKAQANEQLGNYKLTDLRLEYEVIQSAGLAESVRGTYNAGRSFPYNYVTCLQTPTWPKNNIRETITSNIPLKSLKAIILLFTEDGAGDSEHFPFPHLTHVDATVEGTRNGYRQRGLAKRDMYSEAVRFFNDDNCKKYLGSNTISKLDYYTNKFACVIDFRTVDDNTVSGSGRKLVGTQAGVLMEIAKEATTSDLTCHVFVVADGAIDIMGTQLNGDANY